MKNIVALVDSGVDKEKCIRKDKITIDKKFNAYKINRSFHGTLCAFIIQGISEKIDIYSVSILDENESTNYKKLQEALEYLKNKNAKIINLSMATENYDSRFALEKVCNSLVAQGKIIVAAADNLNGRGYPASLENVIGVKGLRTMCQNEFWYNTEYTIQCACDMSPVLVPVDDVFMIFAGTSKAAAIISAKISQIINENEDIDYRAVQEILEKHATKNMWNTKQRYLDSKTRPSFPYIQYDSREEELCKVVFALSNVVGHKITIDQVLAQGNNLLRYGLNCANGCKFLSTLESLFNFKINRPVQYYRLLDIGAVLGLIEEFKNEKLEKTV